MDYQMDLGVRHLRLIELCSLVYLPQFQGSAYVNAYISSKLTTLSGATQFFQ